jgi:phage baseplate assembly protein gpV
MTAGYQKLTSNLGAMMASADRGRMVARVGLVSSYDPDGYIAKVRVMPEDVESGWLPIAVGMAGQAWGAYFGPSIDDQVIVLFIQGDINSGVIIGALSSDQDPPPRIMPGEIHLRARDDTAAIVLGQDGTITSRGEWTHVGPLHVSETVTVGVDVLAGGLVKAGDISLSEHNHDQPNDSHGDAQQPTDPPNPS